MAKHNVIILLAALAWATPARACHRFHIWKYPYPQQCRVTSAPAHLPRADDDNSWYVEITREPDDLAREKAIEMLKRELAQ